MKEKYTFEMFWEDLNNGFQLYEKGYTEPEIKKIWGGNFFRVMNTCRKAGKK